MQNKINNNASASNISDKDNTSATISKKLRFDNSLLKAVEFDDLITNERMSKVNENDNEDIYLETSPNYEANALITDISPMINLKNSSKDNLGSNININLSNSMHYNEDIAQTKHNPGYINTHRNFYMNLNKNSPFKTKQKNISAENRYDTNSSNYNPLRTTAHFKMNLVKKANANVNVNAKKLNLSSTNKNNPKAEEKKDKTKSVNKKKPQNLSSEQSESKTNRSATPVRGKGSAAKPSERLNHLYSQGRQKEEKIKKLQMEKEQNNLENELKGCTFKPKINNGFRPEKVVTSRKDRSIYERQLIWNNKKVEK
jgi:hypothetical protein